MKGAIDTGPRGRVLARAPSRR
ncbi:hypothetical protein BC2230_10011 [Burkholderia cepacia]